MTSSDDAAAHQPWRISLIAASILVLELAFIRQIPAEVRVISYFTNLVLMAAFFGLGLGAILQPRVKLAWTVPLGLFFVAGFVAYARGLLIFEEANSVHYWLTHEVIEGEARYVPAFVAAAAAFVASATPFLGLGQALVGAMDHHPRLIAYSWDIGGSIAGTLLFTVGSALLLPPWLWPVLVGALWAWLFARSLLSRILHVAAGLSFLLFASSPLPSTWSPYYLVQHQAEPEGLRVFVNSSFHQFAIDWTDDSEATREMRENMATKFSKPYEVYRGLHEGDDPERVLVLGAGTGNDVAVALMNGAQHVTAVEIDPVILELGQTQSAPQPYASDKVHAVVDDARHFLSTTAERFDLVVLGTLDSQTLLSGHANLRLENYVYTAEAFEKVGTVLDDDGMLALYYSAVEPWLRTRLAATLAATFGDACKMEALSESFLFNTIATCAPNLASHRSDPGALERFTAGVPAATDDWPYLYLRGPAIGSLYLKLFAFVGVLILAAIWALRRVHPVRGLHGNFLFLGLGFTLIEAAAIVRLALVFGSTWTVNALVFAAVLSTIFLANLLVLKDRAPTLNQAWAGVVVGLLANFLLPLQLLLVLPGPARALAAGALIAIPVFFAAICFSRLFAREDRTGFALGINLVGAMAGGLLEYLSMLVGMRSIWLVALVIYLLAMLATRIASSSAAARSS